MLMEYTAEILRGWPSDGARERLELVKQGSVLVNGDVVEMQSDGTVDKVSSTKSRRVGLVLRGNGDSASAASSNGRFMTPQPAKAITAMTWTGGVLSVTVVGHGYVAGNTVTIAGTTATGTDPDGTYVITGITSADVFTVALSTDIGTPTLTSSTATQGSAINNSGKAVVLWGNYIVKTSNYTAGAYVPGSPVTGQSGKFNLANGSTDPECGFVLRVQAAGGTGNTAESAHLVIVAF